MSGSRDLIIEYISAIDDAPGGKSLFAGDPPRRFNLSSIDASTLGEQAEAFCSAIASAFSRAATVMAGYQLEGFDVSVELTAEGGLRMIASATSSVTGGLTLSFRKTDAKT